MIYHFFRKRFGKIAEILHLRKNLSLAVIFRSIGFVFVSAISTLRIFSQMFSIEIGQIRANGHSRMFASPVAYPSHLRVRMSQSTSIGVRGKRGECGGTGNGSMNIFMVLLVFVWLDVSSVSWLILRSPENRPCVGILFGVECVVGKIGSHADGRRRHLPDFPLPTASMIRGTATNRSLRSVPMLEYVLCCGYWFGSAGHCLLR